MFIAKRYHSHAYGNKSSSLILRSKVFLISLLGFLSFVQFCCQYLMWSTTPKDLSQDAFAEDGECVIMPGTIAQSPECMEAHLFHSWQQEAAMSDQASITSQPSMLATTSVSPDTTSIKNSVAVANAAKEAAVKAAEQTRAQFQEVFANNPPDSLSENRDLQEHFEALPGIHRKITEDKLAELGIQLDANDHQKELDDIYAKVTESLQSRSSLTDWDKSLVDMQSKLEKRHEDLKNKHHHHHHHTQWLTKKTSLRGGAHHHHDHAALSKDLAKMDAQWDTSHKEAQAAHRVWEKGFSEKMLAIGKELCDEPERRNTPACAVFHPQTHDEWQDNFTNATHSFVHELCSDPRRRNYPVCQRENNADIDKQAISNDAVSNPNLRKGNAKMGAPLEEADTTTPASVASPPRSRSLRGQSHSAHLEWTAVKAWKASVEPDTNLRELANIQHDKVRYVHWQGAIPKVGCITAIPPGAHAGLQMRYFIDNFKLQAYEGSKQLILVYHHADQEAADLVKDYADGSIIKGVAARGVAFPSSEALRFGAWSSDADVIAHWEFDEFHHIERLSVQVRAMAMSSRPASILKEASSGTSKDAVDGLGRVETLTGEATWMREHWSPLRHLDQSTLKVHAHQLAQVEI